VSIQPTTEVTDHHARLWEISIVIALRDMQWKMRHPNAPHPEPYLSIAGGFEQSGADALLKVKGRLFFFEIKADRSKIKEEWSKENKQRRSKLAFRSARRAMRIYGKPVMPPHLPSVLHQSLQCHHFIYWVATNHTGSKRAGHLVVEPYLLGVIRTRLLELKHSKDASKTISEEYHLGLLSTGDFNDIPSPAKFVRGPDIPLSNIQKRQAALIRRAHPHDNWSKLGLPLSEFKGYLKDLFACQRHGHQPINAVVMSEDGQFFQHITDTSQLEAIFLRKLKAKPQVEIDSSSSDEASLPDNVGEVVVEDTVLRSDPERMRDNVRKQGPKFPRR
jgi:hypothetical protein